MSRKEHNSGTRPPSNRQLKVGEEIRHALSNIFIRGDLFHNPTLPALKSTSVTVAEVRVSPDLREARAYVTPLGGGNPQPIVDELNRIAPMIRTEVTKNVQMKFSPKITFHADNSYENVNRIESLLRKPEVARDLELERSGKKE